MSLIVTSLMLMIHLIKCNYINIQNDLNGKLLKYNFDEFITDIYQLKNFILKKNDNIKCKIAKYVDIKMFYNETIINDDNN